jgi:hypothetical protein
MFRFARTFAPIVGLLIAYGCSNPADLGSPRITDVDVARNAWVSNHPSSYVFDVAIASSWVAVTPYYRVTVVGGQVVAAVKANGAPADGFTTTIDSIWDGVLASRANHQLNSAEFDARGVPIEVDYGPWPVDGGVHYSVRNFSTR